MKIIKPPHLNLGETIGIISPSQSIHIEKKHLRAFKRGIQRIKKAGFKVKLGKYAKEKYFYSAGNPEQRAYDLHEMFKDNEMKAILMSIEGETANEVLPLVDFNLIKRNPKIFLGMSDGATLLAPITDKTGLITFYGPDLIYSFGIQKGAREFENQMWDCIMRGEAKFKPLRKLVDDSGNKIKSGWKNIRRGKARGRLAGGYLEIIMNLVGAGYLSYLQNSILYLESMEGSHTIHMRLQYLKLMKVFDKINGLILGYFPDIEKDKKFYRPIGEIVLELTKNKDFPILQVNELGHMVKNYTWPNGLMVELDATKQRICALEKCVS